MSEPRQKKRFKFLKRKPVSFRRFVVGMVSAVLIFSVLFTVGMLGVDTIKYTIEADEAIQRMENAIIVSERSARTISQNYELEMKQKLLFAAYLYEHDPEILKEKGVTILPAGNPFAVYDDKGSILYQDDLFPNFSRGRILNYIEEFRNGGDDTGYVTTDEAQRVLFAQVQYGVYIAMVENLGVTDYIAGSLSNTRAIIEASRTRQSFSIGERNGLYFAGPDWLDVPEGTPIEEVIGDLENAIGSDDNLSELFVGKVNGRHYFALRKAMPDTDGIIGYYLLDIGYIVSQSLNTIVVTLLTMLSALVVLLYYLYQYRKDRLLNTPEEQQLFRSKRRVLFILGIAVTALVAYYARTVFCISSYVMDDEQEIEELNEKVTASSEAVREVVNTFRYGYNETSDIIARYLSARPEARNRETLRELSGMFGLNYLMVFDENGNEVVSDSNYLDLSLSSDPEAQTYALRPLLNGVDVSAVTGINDMTGEYEAMAGSPLCDAKGRPEGMVLASIPADQEQKIELERSLDTILDEIMSGGQTEFFLVNQDDRYFVHTPHSMLDYMSVEDYGFTEEVLTPGFSGRVDLGNAPYYMTQGELNSLYVYAAVPFSVVFGTRFVFTFLAAAAAAVLFLIGASRIQRVKITRISAGNESMDPAMNGHGELTKIAGETGRKKERRPGSRITPEDRTTVLLMRIIQGVGAVMAVVLLFRDRLLPENSMIRFVMDGNWPHGMNVYAVTAIMILVLTAMVGVTMVLGVLRILSRILSPRAETICRLLRSAVEYLSVLMVAYTAFGFLGVRVETLITTTSVMALLVGMGAQDLTQDIIAGLFLMFESEFQVGDVIDTGGKIGIVREIGLHSTKLIDMNNNVLIISNSKLADIINRTQRTSFAFVDFAVSSDVKIRDLEALFREKLPPLRKKYPKLIGAPYFRGVTTFTGATMKCSVAAEVMEKDRIPMERILNKEVLHILQDASISPM